MSETISQMTLVTGIMKLVSDASPELEFSTRKYNAIITAADTLIKSLNEPFKPAMDNMGLAAWLQSDDVGSSSKFLALKLARKEGTFVNYEHPHDISDFQRCRKMLDAVPELKDKLHLIAKESKVWSGLVDDWEVICHSIDYENYEKAHALICEHH